MPCASWRGVPSGFNAPPASQYGVPPSSQSLLPFWKSSGTSLPHAGLGTPTLGSQTHPPLTRGPENESGPGRLALKQLSANAAVIGASRNVTASATTARTRRSMGLLLVSRRDG